MLHSITIKSHQLLQLDSYSQLMMYGHEVPILRWEDLEEDNGPLLNDIFLGCNTPPRASLQEHCVVFVDPDGDNNDGYHQNKWFDEYVSLDNPTNFSTLTEYDSNMSYFHQSNNHQIQDLTSSSTSTIQFAQLNIEPTVSENDYSPGSAYSSDWSNGSEHSSIQSQDEILDEIHRECAEIERKSVSTANKTHAKKRLSTQKTVGFENSDRKKELNRMAATKYREKKRREKEMLGSERKQLESRNTQLRATVNELKMEVKYLKNLIKDIENRAFQD